MKKLQFRHVRSVVMEVIIPNSGLSILLHGVISLPDTRSYDTEFSMQYSRLTSSAT